MDLVCGEGRNLVDDDARFVKIEMKIIENRHLRQGLLTS